MRTGRIPQLATLCWLRRPRAASILVIGAVGSLLAAAAPAVAATGSGPPGKVPVAQGLSAAALKNAKVFRHTPAKTPEIVSFVLRARNLGTLERLVEAGVPGGYLSVPQFAGRYGQPRSNIRALARYLGQYKIRTRAYADGLDVTAHGTAGEFDKALSVRQSEYRVPAVPARQGRPGRPALSIHGTTDKPLLPASLARFVLSILGLTNYPAFASNAVHEPRLAKDVTPSATQTGSLTPADFAKQYNLDPLYRRGATGRGATIGIVTLASIRASDPEHFWANVLKIRTKPDRITLENVDGGAGKVSNAAGSGETALDVEQSGALAPDANIVVYQAPNTDPGFLDAFFDAASQNVADSVSTSWGESETIIAASVNSGHESATYAQTFNEAFLELAAQGQSSFVASGDNGAYDASGDIGTTNLSVDNPGDSPWTTSAGGTTLAGTIPLTSKVSVTIPAQRTWGWDWLWPYYALFGYTAETSFIDANALGGGGGVSTFERAPAYQEFLPGAHTFSAVEYLLPIDYKRQDKLYLPTSWLFTAKPPVTIGSVSPGLRVTPDLVADADPFTGYLLYFSGQHPHLQAGWGGTSFVAPQLNGATALIDSYLGRRVGFWNPAIYRFAAGPRSPFTPLDTQGTSNDNLYYTGTPAHIYNIGSGLGYPNLTRLADDFGR
jgi:subtilase family serine protease